MPGTLVVDTAVGVGAEEVAQALGEGGVETWRANLVVIAQG